MATVNTVPDEPGQPPALTAPALAAQSAAKEQVITPFDVSGGVDETGKPIAIDYDKIVEKFGSRRIDKPLLEKFERVTGRKPHRLLRRGMVFSHRDLNSILDRFEKQKQEKDESKKETPFFLYTGRGREVPASSSSMHVGHSVPFEFTKYLQDVFDVPLVIMLTDDEKFYHTQKLTIEECYKFALANAEDIIAIGFDIKKTFIFIDTKFLVQGYGEAFHENVMRMGKRTTINQIKGTFGFGDSHNIAEFGFPAMQSATSFATSFPFIFGSDAKKAAKIPCLIPCAIDQDPYFRQCRDNAAQLKYIKPALIHSVFLPSLRGAETKMSASDLDSSIYLADTDKQIKKKVGNAFSGGQDDRETHRLKGGRTEKDIPFQYLKFFLEDDEELERVRVAYETGKMESGEMKALCTRELQAYVNAFKERRKAVTAEVRDEFLRPRRLDFEGAPPVGKTLVTPADSKVELLEKENEAMKKRLAELEQRLEVGGLGERLEKA